MYKTGIETKQNILTAARELFHAFGLRGTSVNMICEKADVKLGTFTYYFPRKNDLLSLLYTEYMQKCADFIDAEMPDLSPAEHHLHAVTYYYCRLYSDEQTVRFHHEVLDIGSMNVWFHNPRILIAEFSGRNIRGTDEDDFALCVLADNAVRRELNLDFIRRDDHSPRAVYGLLHDIYRINARLFDVDLSYVEECLKKAYDFALAHQDAGISLL